MQYDTNTVIKSHKKIDRRKCRKGTDIHEKVLKSEENRFFFKSKCKFLFQKRRKE